MEKTYCCTNKECSSGDKDEFVMVLDQESIMDEQNLAQMFCPRCKSRLTKCQEEDQAESGFEPGGV